MSRDFITGPQAPLSDNYFHKTLVEKARIHGATFPVSPPTDPNILNGEYTLANYYDQGLNQYIVHQITGDPIFQTYARKITDSWWKRPDWIGEGKARPWPDTAPTPKFIALGGLILRAIDGRPEMWDWINSYTRFVFDHWAKKRIGAGQLFYGVREGAFALEYATWLAKVLPDSFPLQAGGMATNGGQLRAAYLADIETTAVGYYGKLQQADGSWRWDSGIEDYGDTHLNLASAASKDATSLTAVSPVPETIPAGEVIHFPSQGAFVKTTAIVPAGSKTISITGLSVNLPLNADGQYAALRATMQSFQIGLLLRALVNVHILTGNEIVKGMILKGCRHLYEGGPYAKDILMTNFGVRARGFHYFKHGGTTVNPTKYEQGSINPNTTIRWHIESDRQAISTILSPYGYAYVVSRDLFFMTAGDELFDSAYGGGDGFRAMMADTAKNYNQHGRNGSYLAWAGQPTTLPLPNPIPPQPPTATPSPDGTEGPTVTDSVGAVWTLGPTGRTLRNGVDVGGAGKKYLYWQKTVYLQGMSDGWFKWTGTDWRSIGTTRPPAPIVQPAPLPHPVPVKDEYVIKTLESADAARTSLLQEMWGLGYGAWEETKGVIKFRLFPKP